MNITWHGHSCFQIVAQTAKNSQAIILTDPFSDEIGLKMPKTKPDIVLVSHGHNDHSNLKKTEGNPFVVEGPGEYEVRGVNVHGISSFHDEEKGKKRGNNTIYTIEAEEMTLCHLGDFGEKELGDAQIEAIGNVDILMIPVGGTYTVNAKDASKIVSQIGPRIVIPMHYQLPKLKIKIDKVEEFLKIMGVGKKEPLPKLSVKKKEIPLEGGTEVVILECK